MPTGSTQFIGLERLPAEGTLVVPGHLDFQELQALEKQFAGRPITWLVEESALVEHPVRDHLSREKLLRRRIFRRRSLPTRSRRRPPSKNRWQPPPHLHPRRHPCPRRNRLHDHDQATPASLCDLGLPLTPLAVHNPSECALAIEPASKLPSAIFAVGHPVPAGQTTIAPIPGKPPSRPPNAPSPPAPSSNGSLGEALIAGLKKWGSSCRVYDGSDDSSLPYGKLMGAAIAALQGDQGRHLHPRIGIILPPGKAGLLANLAVVFAGKIP